MLGRANAVCIHMDIICLCMCVYMYVYIHVRARMLPYVYICIYVLQHDLENILTSIENQHNGGKMLTYLRAKVG